MRCSQVSLPLPGQAKHKTCIALEHKTHCFWASCKTFVECSRSSISLGSNCFILVDVNSALAEYASLVFAATTVYAADDFSFTADFIISS